MALSQLCRRLYQLFSWQITSLAAVAILVTLLICGTVGLINGLLVVYAGITPFIATLAMLSIVEGFSYIIQTGELIQISDKGFASFFAGSLGPIPAPVIIFLVIMASPHSL